jgi:hypothetical protein
MLKVVAGLVAGLIVALAAMYVIWLVGLQFFPLSNEGGFPSGESLRSVIRNMSTGSQVCIVLSWLGGSFLGALTAAHISRRLWPAWIVTIAVMLSCVANVLMFPHPEWLQFAAFIVPVAGGLLATHRARTVLRSPVVANG